MSDEWEEIVVKQERKIKDVEPEPLEDLLREVEYCISNLEDPQVSLEDSFRYYEQGINKLKKCHERVAQLEQRMLVLNNRGELEEFTVKESDSEI